MPKHVSVFIAEHRDNTSNEVALEEAMAGDKALAALGFNLVGGAYANEGDEALMSWVRLMVEDDGA